MYFDTHCHLNSEQLYENRDEFIKHALDNQVEMMVVVGYDLESSKKAVEIAKEYDFIYAAVGIGPNDCLNTTTQDLQIIDEYLNEPKVVALGEIGLDYTFDCNREKNKSFDREYNLSISKKEEILLKLEREHYVKSEESMNKEHINDTVHIFKINEKLMPRYDELADYRLVCIYIKVTWPEGKEPMFIISFHEDEEI